MMVITEEEEKKIIQNILDGNKDCECILYEKYHKILSSYLNRKYPKDLYVEDHVSEILIKTFLSLKKYNPEKGNFKNWIFKIAKNYMIDYYKSPYTGILTLNSCNYSVGDEFKNVNTTHFNDDAFTYTTSCDMDNFHNTNALNYVTSQIDGDDFSFLNMHYNLGYSYNEIGSEFNMTSNTISNRVSYIKTKLKNLIERDIVLD